MDDRTQTYLEERRTLLQAELAAAQIQAARVDVLRGGLAEVEYALAQLGDLIPVRLLAAPPDSPGDTAAALQTEGQ
jgi:hypothetical protein